MKQTFSHTSSRPLTNRGGGGGGIFCALATVVIVAALFAVSCVRPAEDDSPPRKEAARLSSLTVQHIQTGGTQAVTDLIEEGGFDPSQRNYEISLEEYNIQDGVITVAGEAEEEGAELVFKPESIELPIYDATTIAVYHENDMETPAYTVVIMPPQDNDPNNYDLLSLSLHFNVDGANLIQGFSGSSQSYSVNLEKGVPNSVFIDAKAASSVAQIKIADGQTVLSNYKSSGNTAVAAVPTSDSKVITVSVKKQENEAYKDYTITLNAYAPTITTYTGTIQGVNTPYTITGLIAREAGGTSGQSALLGADPKTWSLKVNSDWTPHSFIVEMKDANRVSYKSAVIVPQSVVEQGTVVTVAGFGKVLASVQDLQSINTDTTTKGGSYVLGQDLDLKDVTNWSAYSPVNFCGKFYGNGYTIDNLLLDKGNGEVGFFASLGNNAYLENFTVNVSSKENLVIDGSLYFGGIAGVANNGGVVKIKGVKVKGSLSIGNLTMTGNRYILLGGFFGEVNNAAITMENCASEVDISIDSKTVTASTGSLLGIGGFVGKTADHGDGGSTIKNCYATGDIDIVFNGDKSVFAGGFAGIIQGGPNNLENCFASGSISVKNNIAAITTAFEGGSLAAGGLVGYISNNGTPILKNCASIGKKAVAAHAGTVTAAKYGTGRLVGLDNKNTPALTYNNNNTDNYALYGMLTGDTLEGTPDNSDGGATTAGIAKSAADFKSESTWRALQFSESVWDFSTIARDGRPTLR